MPSQGKPPHCWDVNLHSLVLFFKPVLQETEQPDHELHEDHFPLTGQQLVLQNFFSSNFGLHSETVERICLFLEEIPVPQFLEQGDQSDHWVKLHKQSLKQVLVSIED